MSKYFEIERVESQCLEPSDEYVRQSLMQPTVRQYLAKKRYKTSLYMIVGLKIGRNARIMEGKHFSIDAMMSSDLSGTFGVPVDITMNVGSQRRQYTFLERKVPQSFVFAYRLREVRYSVKSNRISTKLFTKGAELFGSQGNQFMRSMDESIEGIGGYFNSFDPRQEIEYDGVCNEDLSGDRIVDPSQIIDECVLVGPPPQFHFWEHEKTGSEKLKTDVFF